MIHVLVHYTSDWKELSELSEQNLQAYCDKHGYYFGSYITPPYAKYTGKEKVEMINYVVGENEIALVIDCDALVTNMNVKIEDYLEDDKDFYITKDVHGINTGVFIIRKTRWADSFLYWLVERINTHNYIHCEQDAVDLYMRIMPKYAVDKIKIVAHPSFNSYPYEIYPECGSVTHEHGNWEHGDFILHVPSKPISQRIEILKNAKVIYE